MRLSHVLPLSAALLALPSMVMAQTQQPDAGQTLQQLQQPPQIPQQDRNLSIAAPTATPAQPGGPTVTVSSIAIDGNSVYSDSVLLAIMGPVKGQAFDLAGLKNLANRITAFYHAGNYPFAHALIPAQSMKDGHLRIQVIEGRYGTVKAVSKNKTDAASAQKFLQPLASGTLIEGGALERATLILDDQPGYGITPIIRPGQDVGTGDLLVDVKRESRFGGDIGFDNYGNTYTGRGRARADLYANSPFLFGDQVRLSTLYTEGHMWYGSLGYEAPLGASGLRGSFGYAHTYYELGRNFKTLQAHGTAKVASAGLNYPIIRTQKANLKLAGTYQHKWLVDQQDVTGASDNKFSDSVPLMLNFDRRDGFLSGGVMYGTAAWTHGVLSLDNGLEIIDRRTARTGGGFDKFNLDVARLQSLPARFSFFGRFSGQVAGENLDSSESFGLGGPGGVRAYPTGESYGDEGWLAQAELRYTIDAFTPYAFYDAGYIHINADPWTTGENERSVGGTGVGMRFNLNSWYADSSVAWRTYGGDPQADTRDIVPTVWFNAGYRF